MRGRLRGFRDAFLPHLTACAARSGARRAASLGYCDGSTLARGAAIADLDPAEGPPQDPYSLRCAPPWWARRSAALEHIETVLTAMICAVTDNPLIFLDDDRTPRITCRATPR